MTTVEPVLGAGQLCRLCNNVHDLMSACPPRTPSPPYPWCRQPSVCRGTCPMEQSCGD